MRCTAYPFGAFTRNPSVSVEGCHYYRYTVNKPIPSCNRLKCNEDYIITGLSTAPHNESDLKLSLGYNDLTVKGVKVIEYSENRLQEACRVRIPYKPFQTDWIPSHPQLLAVASKDIRFYEYENQNLILRKSFLEGENNPVISMDCDCRQPQEMLITRGNGLVAILSLEYGTPIELIGNRESSYRFLRPPQCGARFGRREMEHCIILVDDNIIKVFDRQFVVLHRHLDYHNGLCLSVECSKHNGYLISTLTKTGVYLHDLRFFRTVLDAFDDFDINEYTNCFCWSPHAPELYIGTSAGAVVKWKTVEGGTAERWYNENKNIESIHYPEADPDLLFVSCNKSPRDLFASTIEVYFRQSLNSRKKKVVKFQNFLLN